MKCNRTQEECRDPQLCAIQGCPGTLPNMMDSHRHQQVAGALKDYAERVDAIGGIAHRPPQPDRLREAANTIRAALKEDTVLYKHYLAHAAKMLEQEDLHGLWDAAMNASEVSNRLDAYRATLEAMGASE